MIIKEIQIDKIKPDPNQPRQSFDPARIEEIAQSMKTAGVINPIELDEDLMIITGEIRWRAAREAELNTVPCKILDINDNERFMRQVIENIHHNTMSAYDTAKAMEKLLGVLPGNTLGGKQPNDKGISILSEKIGKSRATILEYLNILQQSEEMQKAIREEKIKHTALRASSKVENIKHKERINKKILKGDFGSRDGSIAVARAINAHPEKAEELLKEKYGTVSETYTKIKKIIPGYTETPITDFVKENNLPIQEVSNIAIKLYQWCRENPMENLNEGQAKKIAVKFIYMKRCIESWLKNIEVIGENVIEGELIKK